VELPEDEDDAEVGELKEDAEDEEDEDKGKGEAEGDDEGTERDEEEEDGVEETKILLPSRRSPISE